MRKTKTGAEHLRSHLRPGRVYRREDLANWSNSVDRHLMVLMREGALKKLRGGVYYCPKRYEFGEAPAEENQVLEAFLKSNRFVVTSPNAYNQLGLGTTQLYNRRVVYNQKRHGTFELGGRTYRFERRPNVPSRLSEEFLLVDLVNELDQLAEDQDAVLAKVKERVTQMDHRRLTRAVTLYGNYSTRKRMREYLEKHG